MDTISAFLKRQASLGSRARVVIEGVPYYRYVVRFRTVGGKRHRLVHWSPGPPWLHGEVARRLDEVFGVEQITPWSCVINGMGL